jgi:hypothetical protein
MSRQTEDASPLREDLRKAIHVRAEQLFDVVTQAENDGVLPGVIAQQLNEELEVMRAQLSAIYPPEIAQAILGELMAAYELCGQSSSFW